MDAPQTSGELAESKSSVSDDCDVATLYFGNLHPYVQQRSLEDLCTYFGPVESAKVIKDKGTGTSAGYGFVKFADKKGAEAALQALNGQNYLGEELRVNWALPNNHKEDTSYHYHVFVGDLGSDVTDAILYNTFCTIGQCSDARVMWDHNTGRSKGYGFVSFRRKEDAEAAIEMMQSKQIGSRRIRVGWAQHKQDENSAPLDFNAIDRADPSNTNIYIGNISPETNEAGLTAHFQVYGPVAEVKLHKKGGYGFVKFEQHKSAVKAIVGQHGKELDGRVLKCSWCKNITSSRNANASASSALSLAAALQSTQLSGGVPQGNSMNRSNTQSVMASLAAAAAAANAVAAVTNAAATPGVHQFGSYSGNQGLDAQHMGSGFGAFLPQGLMGFSHGLNQVPSSMAGGPAVIPGQHGMMGMGGSHMMYNKQHGLPHQVNQSQAALITQMMMMQGLQCQQDGLNLQGMSGFSPTAMGSMDPTAITAGNISLDPPSHQRGNFNGFYGFDGGAINHPEHQMAM